MKVHDGLRLGRYVIYDEVAAGGMATVHIGRLLGPVGFSRTVAIKRLHPQYAKDPEFVAMLLDEARLAGRIRHPNVVTTLDVVAARGELFLVMEYVAGDSFAVLLRQARPERPSPAIISAIVGQALLGLQAAHEATDERGRPLCIVHRDVSPQNVLVGVDGTARVVDFGVAKAASRVQTTSEGQLKGKLAYMAPEQLLRRPVDHRADLFAAGVVIWEALVGQRLFASDDPAAAVARVLACEVERPSKLAELPSAVDDFALRALAARPSDRFASAREMAVALHAALPPASTLEVGEWVTSIGGDALCERARRIAELESSWPEPLDWDPPDQPAASIPVLASDPTLRHDLAPPAAEPRLPAEEQRARGFVLSPLAAAALVVAVAASAIAGYRWLAPKDGPRPPVAIAPSVEPSAPAPPEPSLATTASGGVPSMQPAVLPRTLPRKRSASRPRPTSAPKPGLAPLKEYE